MQMNEKKANEDLGRIEGTFRVYKIFFLEGKWM